MNMSERKLFISGTGYCVPDGVVTNSDLEKIMDTTDEFIRHRTGVHERRHVTPETSLSDLAKVASEQAIENAEIEKEEIDLIIVNTLSPDHHDPSQACDLQRHLQLYGVPAFDIRAQCSGALYGMDIAQQYLATGRCRNVLLVCAEILSRRMDLSNDGRNLSILLSDGAGAMILSGSNDSHRGLLDVEIRADGREFELLYTKAPGSRRKNFIDDQDIQQGAHYFRMNGKAMFEHAVNSMADVATEILNRNKLTVSDIALIVPHQPNLRLLEAVLKKLNVSRNKAIITVEHFGNMASASMPVAFAQARQRGHIKENQLIMFLTYGAGATWGAALYQS